MVRLPHEVMAGPLANVPNARPLFRCCRRVSEHLLNRGATKLVSRRSHSVEFPLPRVGGSLHRGSVSSSRTCRVRFYTMTTTLPLPSQHGQQTPFLIVHAELTLEDTLHLRCLMNLLVSVTVALLCHSLPLNHLQLAWHHRLHFERVRLTTW
jgi:hypothetical protein